LLVKNCQEQHDCYPLSLLSPPCYLPTRTFRAVLFRSLKNLIRIELNDNALDGLAWRDFGNGLAMSRLARERQAELVLYRIRADASHEAFLRHEHIGGELYLVLRGKIADETGEYGEGDIVFLDRQSVHTPRAIGETIVLVLWPEGVRIVD
jgi:anti-sigma factor ChrR (cupin superfamily)